LSKLSLSIIVLMRLGTFTKFIIAEALTASVEPITPPKRKPKANENPGNTILATHATGGAGDSVPEIAPLLTATADFLRALAAGSDPVWIEDDADELADRVTCRDSALLATADELTDAARRAAAGLLD